MNLVLTVHSMRLSWRKLLMTFFLEIRSDKLRKQTLISSFDLVRIEVRRCESISTYLLPFLLLFFGAKVNISNKFLPFNLLYNVI